MFVIITGVGRSGTTLLSTILSSHSKIAIPYESNFFDKYYTNRQEYGCLNDENNRRCLVNDLLNEPRVKQWDHTLTINDIDTKAATSIENAINALYQAYASKDNKPLWGDKSPGYVDKIDTLWKIFPDTKIIHIYRDGRDVALSTMAYGWWSISDFRTTVYHWGKKVRCALDTLNNHNQQQHFSVKYEDFVADPKTMLLNICRFLGLDYEPAMLETFSANAAKKVRTGMIDYEHKNLQQLPTTAHCYKWKKRLSPIDQVIAFEAAGEILCELGYDSGITRCNRLPLKLRHIYHYLVNTKYRARRLLIKLIKRKWTKSPYLYKKS